MCIRDRLFNLLNREMGDRPLTVLFVLTKTDDERIPKEMKRNNFAVLSERAVQTFGMIYQMVQNLSLIHISQKIKPEPLSRH